MRHLLATTLLLGSLAAPAFAYSTRIVEFDPAAELQRSTGAAQYPESAGGIVREGRIGRGGSEAYPTPTRGIAHGGTDLLTGSSSRYPVLTQDQLSHPPTAFDQDQMLTEDFPGNGPRPVTVVGGGFSGDTGN